MSAKVYKMLSGDTATNATEAALTGVETIDATVGAGEISIIVDDGVSPLNTNIVDNTIDALRNFLKESNKDT